MVGRSGISHRWSVLDGGVREGSSPVDPGGFYHRRSPCTGERMKLYEEKAPALALDAAMALAGQADLSGVTHLVVASCTGFTAPGVDQIVAQRLGLSPSVERVLVGFMGCYAAAVALRTARHIVRSEPEARVLVICVELSSLHMQEARDLETMLVMLQFGDGAAAALVTGEARGLAMGKPFSATLPDSEALIQWHIGDHGFDMLLSGEVPHRLAGALGDPAVRATLFPAPVEEIDGWAVHAGGRSILDAVAGGLGLDADALDDSRAVLDGFGNMSSATLMFVLARMLDKGGPRQGVAIAFGPGLAAEGFGFAGVR